MKKILFVLVVCEAFISCERHCNCGKIVNKHDSITPDGTAVNYIELKMNCNDKTVFYDLEFSELLKCQIGDNFCIPEGHAY